MEPTEINLQPAYLHNELVTIKPLRGKEFEALHAIASDPLIWEGHPARDRYKREVFQRFYDDAVQSKSAFLIYDNASHELIGTSRFYEYNSEGGSIAIGYTFLARKYWGGLYNKAMKTLLLDYAFQFVDLVFFHIGALNIRSQKAVLKLGGIFVREYLNESSQTPSLYHEYVIKKEVWTQKEKA